MSAKERLDSSSNSDQLKSAVVQVRRCVKVVEGGRQFRFSVLVVVGDGRGRCGFALGKSSEIAEARSKAVRRASKSLQRIQLNSVGRGGTSRTSTVYNRIDARHGASGVILLPAPSGTGVIAGGAVRPMLEVLGVTDIVVKIVGSTNPHNVLRAAMKGLSEVESPRRIAAKRGKSVAHIMGRSEKKDADSEGDESAVESEVAVVDGASS